MLIHNPPGGHPVALQLWNTGQRMGLLFDERLALTGTSRYQFFVFMALDRLVDPSQREVAAAVGIDDATLIHHLTAMERAGLIERTRDANDRRIQRVTLTRAGERQWAAINEAVDRYNEAQLEGITIEEIGLLADLLGRIDANSTRLLSASAAARA